MAVMPHFMTGAGVIWNRNIIALFWENKHSVKKKRLISFKNKFVTF